MPLDDSLNVGHLMARDYGEPGRFGSYRLVLGHGQRDLLRTVSVATLAAEVEPAVTGIARDEPLGNLCHALVDLTEEGFVRPKTLLARAHGDIVCRYASPRKVCCCRMGKARRCAGIWGVHAVQTEDIVRSANDRIAEKARELGWRFPVPFVCECSDIRCFARLELTLETYEELRAHPQRYLTVPGHEVAGAVVIEQTECFALAEKLAINARTRLLF